MSLSWGFSPPQAVEQQAARGVCTRGCTQRALQEIEVALVFFVHPKKCSASQSTAVTTSCLRARLRRQLEMMKASPYFLAAVNHL